jgi:lysozyme
MAAPLWGKRLNRGSIFLLGFAVLAGALLYFAMHWQPDRAAYPVQGVDVSNDQGEIAWPNVEADGVDFAYVKATEGAETRDPRFAENWMGASRVGLRRGAYHTYTLCRLASDQATNFIATVPRDAAALPAAVALDFGSDCSERPARSVLLTEVASFIKMVEAHTGKPVLLLLSRAFEDQYQVSSAIDRPLWLKRSAFPPDFGARPWVMWQASKIRRVDGIGGPAHWNAVRQQ